MRKNKALCLALAFATATSAFAGGIITNTNQNIAFNRMFSREASIGIDGVYSNPAGVVFMSRGSHLSLNWQMATQTRTIRNTYPLFSNNANNNDTYRRSVGNAYAPIIPSIQYAYNTDRWSLQLGFSVGGGGGKSHFDNGLGSFERIVANTAVGVQQLAAGIDGASQQMAPLGIANPGLSNHFSSASYTYDSYMRGRQFYYGLQAGAAYKVNDRLAVYAGVRGVYATCNYYGYVRNITVSGVPLYRMIDATRTNSADIELNCDQTGIGFTPVIAVDYKTGRWNFSARYEFKTRMRLKSSSANLVPSIGNLPNTLALDYNVQLLNPELAQRYAGTPYQETVAQAQQSLSSTLTQFGAKFDEAIEKATGEYADGKKVASDIPALLTLGAGYSPTDQLRINAGFHYYWDKQATAYADRNKKLKRGTVELNAGVEYDATKAVTVSAGWQYTGYGLSDDYMDDKSFVVSSNSIGFGACIHLSKRIDLNAAYFVTFYNHYKKSETDAQTALTYTSDYTRTNNVFGLGMDISF